MKRRLHISDFFLKAIALSLRAQGKQADADIFDNIDATTFRYGYISGDKFGSTNNPCKAYGTNIQVLNAALNRQLTYVNGGKTNFSPSVLNTIAMIPKAIRPPYLGDISTPQSNGKVTPEMLKLDLTKPGCSYISISNSDARFIVVIGNDESVTNHDQVTKYMPFDMLSNMWNGGIKETVATDVGYDGRGSSSLSANHIIPVEVWVYKGTVPAPEPKPLNPNLPNWKMDDFSPKAPKGYDVIPAMTLTVDWGVLNQRYKTRVHINQLFVDLISAALTKAGKPDLAAKVNKINPETFNAWKVVYNTAAATVTLTGSRDTTSKLYFDSLTFGNYMGKPITKISDLGAVYHPDSGISWAQVADLAGLQSTVSNGLVYEPKMGYFGKHVRSGFMADEAGVDSILPFSVKGLGLDFRNAGITAMYSPSLSLLTYQAPWCGNNSYQINIYPDRA